MLLSNLGAWSELVFLRRRWVYVSVFIGPMALRRGVQNHLYSREPSNIRADWFVLWWTSTTRITIFWGFVLSLPPSLLSFCRYQDITFYRIHITVAYPTDASYCRILHMNSKKLCTTNHSVGEQVLPPCEFHCKD